MTLKKNELVKVAKELNSLLGLDPEIKTKGVKVDQLKEEVSEAASLIEPGDEISEKTESIISYLREEPQDKGNLVAEEGHGQEEDEEGEEESDFLPGHSPGEEKKEPKQAKQAKQTKPGPDKPTKKSFVEQGAQEGLTIDEMAKKITDSGIDPNHDKNRRIVVAWLSKLGYKPSNFKGA